MAIHVQVKLERETKSQFRIFFKDFLTSGCLNLGVAEKKNIFFSCFISKELALQGKQRVVEIEPLCSRPVPFSACPPWPPQRVPFFLFVS